MSFTVIIVIATVIVSYLCLNDSQLSYKLTLSPYAVKHQKKWWQLFTHGFVHADYGHLAMNMFTLYFLGTAVEAMMIHHFAEKGLFYYSLMYAGGLAFASLPSLLKHKDNPGYLAVGASGAVFGILMAFGMLFPNTQLFLLFPGMAARAPSVVAANADGATVMMLAWAAGNWEHRAYWGANKISYGTDGTASRRYMGALPQTGQNISY